MHCENDHGSVTVAQCLTPSFHCKEQVCNCDWLQAVQGLDVNEIDTLKNILTMEVHKPAKLKSTGDFTQFTLKIKQRKFSVWIQWQHNK